MIRSGDFLARIAAQFNTTVAALVRANPQIEDPNQIFPGQELVIPDALVVIPETGETVYVVQGGDTLTEIAVSFRTTVSYLVDANSQIEDPNLIYPGMRLTIPNTGES